MLKIIPVCLCSPQTKINTFAMLDEGSTITLIDREIAHSIGVNGVLFSVSLNGINDQKAVEIIGERLNIEIENSSGKYKIKNAIAVDKLSLPSQSLSKESIARCGVEFNTKITLFTCADPKILLGQDNWDLIVTRVFLFR